MYDRIIALIMTSDAPEMDLARRILLWINYASTDGHGLKCSMLQTTVRDDDDVEELREFIPVVVAVCGGLVEITTLQTIQFTHLTVKEYLNNRSCQRTGMTALLVPDRPSAAVKITLRSLRYILHHAPSNIPTQQLRTWDGHPTTRRYYSRSFEGFVMRNWWKEWNTEAYQCLSNMNPGSTYTGNQDSIDLLNTISNFLQNPFAIAFWIEGLYRLQMPVLDVVEYLCSWAEETLRQQRSTLEHVATGLANVCTKLRELDKEWCGKLLQTPSLIWDDVLAFRQTGILSNLANVSKVPTATHMIPDAPKHDNGKPIGCLCTVSSTSNDGMTVAVLSIYPSSQFELHWKSIDATTAYREAEKLSVGWIAKYEVWPSDSKTRLASLNIALLQSEIRLLIRQSFCQNVSRLNRTSNGTQAHESFETSFPMAIGHDCCTFAILRTVYHIRPGDSTSNYVLRRSLLPLECLEHFNAKWGAELDIFDPEDFGFLPDRFRLSFRDWHFYTTSFSPDGKYLAFGGL
jgi:hypothetical protein